MKINNEDRLAPPKACGRIFALLLCSVFTGCCTCGRPVFWPHPKICAEETVMGSIPRQRWGFPRFVGEHDISERLSDYGHPSYHNEYPTPDYAPIPVPNAAYSLRQDR